jgi:hypothetical protein
MKRGGSNRNPEHGHFYCMCVIVPGLRVPAKLFRGYNRGNLCLSFQAHILAPMKLPGR